MIDQEFEKKVEDIIQILEKKVGISYRVQTIALVGYLLDSSMKALSKKQTGSGQIAYDIQEVILTSINSIVNDYGYLAPELLKRLKMDTFYDIRNIIEAMVEVGFFKTSEENELDKIDQLQWEKPLLERVEEGVENEYKAFMERKIDAQK
jgi:uncharacterized repeat protein (TIGR04138 family)